MANRLKLIGFICLLLIGLACKKSDQSTTFTGKIVVSHCGVTVIAIDGATGTGGGMAWNNGGISYTNVATIGNYCYLAGLGIRTGDILSFKIVKDNPQTNGGCVMEYCLAPGPDNVIYVSDMVKTGP
jgi:hypothetical protein